MTDVYSKGYSAEKKELPRGMNSRIWTEVDLSAIRHNFGVIRSLVGMRTEVMPVVKANAYGHGLIEVSRALHSAGADWLCVANVADGVALRKVLPAVSICLLAPFLRDEAEAIVVNQLVPLLSTLDQARTLALTAHSLRSGVRAHIEVDTGMGRSGVLPEAAGRLAEQISRLPSILVTGLATHFSSAENNRAKTLQQLALFEESCKAVESTDTRLTILHAANSAALLQVPKSRLTAVRPGLLIYGILPAGSKENARIALQPALTLKATIALVRELPTGSTISYNETCTLTRPARVATLPVGYGDGYPRALSSSGSVLIHGRRAPILGRVCMDMTMVDVTAIPEAVPGSEAVLIGAQDGDRIRAEQLARLIGASEHEITTRIADRVPRMYLNPALDRLGRLKSKPPAKGSVSSL